MRFNARKIPLYNFANGIEKNQGPYHPSPILTFLILIVNIKDMATDDFQQQQIKLKIKLKKRQRSYKASLDWYENSCIPQLELFSRVNSFP